MNGLLIILVIIALGAGLALIYFSCTSKLSQFKDRMVKAEEIIEENLEKKQKVIVNINGIIQKITSKKEYLKEYISTDDMIISNIEKDLKLDEAIKLINELSSDYDELNKDTEFNKAIKNLREIDETLTSAKNLFNQNALKSNTLLKNIPYNIIGKISKHKPRSYYNTNKTDDGEF